nr:DUF1700 domain-containing protein [Lachnospiraceae bacterium]
MNKNEFLSQLEKLLSDLPEEERREAMEYYVEYFDEAGPEKESDVLKEFGSPNEVADRIHEELAEKGLIVYDPDAAKKSGENKNNGWKIACIVLLCIFAAPIVIPLAVAIVAAIMSAIVAVFSAIVGVFFGACGITFALAIAAVVLFVIGIVKVFTTPLVGLFLIGLALMAAGLALLLGFLVVQFCIVVLPWVCRGIYKLGKRIFIRKEKEAEEA